MVVKESKQAEGAEVLFICKAGGRLQLRKSTRPDGRRQAINGAVRGQKAGKSESE